MKNLQQRRYGEVLHKLALGIILCGILLSLPTLCRGDNKNPSYKYSREANENFRKKEAPPLVHHHDHEHSHEHDLHHDHEHAHHSHVHQKRKHRTSEEITSIWLHSLGSTLLISAAPFVLLYAIRLDNSEAMKPRLKVILAFASGGLLGDAFLHLIPHSSHSHSHGDEAHRHGHEHGHELRVGLWVLGGIIAFLAVEKLVRLLKGGGHGHSHNQASIKIVKPKSSKKSESGDQKSKESKEASKTVVAKDQVNEVKITGYLNLAADFAHNFTDGLAIGASYLAGNSIGIVTTITILLHEVPHEIGDFAILIKSGCTKRQAMMLQLVTAFGALAGTALALLGASGEDGSTAWVLPFTAGGFIYIATVSVLPELLEESTKLGQSIKEIVAMLIGVGLMIVIAKLE